MYLSDETTSILPKTKIFSSLRGSELAEILWH